MKKLISIISIIILLGTVLFVLTGCGDKNEINNEQQVDEIEYLETKTGKFYNKFTDGRMYIEYETEYDGEKMKFLSATNGQKIYSESSIDGDKEEGVYMIEGDTINIINHDNNTVTKKTNTDKNITLVGTILKESDIDMSNYTTGTRTIDEKTYETEEWTVDGEKVVMCFDGDNLVYIVPEYEGEEKINKILKTSTTVNDKLFEIPTDYQIIEN